MNTARSLLYVVWLYGAMVVVGGGLAPYTLFNRRGGFIAMRWWGRAALWGLRWICGARVVIEGRENIPKGGALIALKHQSMLDTIAPLTFLDAPAFVAKRELFSMPIFGWYLSRTGMFKLDRGGQSTALKAMVRAARVAVADGRQFLIFPEGTRQELDAPPDYKPGVAALYKDLGLPCTPVALSTGLVWPAHGITRKPGVATIKVLPPIPPGLSRDEFMTRLEQTLESETQALLPPHLRTTRSA